MNKWIIVLSIVILACIGVILLVWNEQKRVQDTIVAVNPDEAITEEVQEGNVTKVNSKKVVLVEEKEIPKKIKNDVHFVVQAPLAQWENELFQDACEEASILMVNTWLHDKKRAYSKKDATEELEKMFLFEKQKYGQAFDLSTEDTMQLFKEYYSVQDISVTYDIDSDDIVQALAEGNIVIVPSNGQKLDNPYFTAPGPERHMLVITGYDQKNSEFTTNDPGTRRGEDYRYSYETLMTSVRDYPTGHKEPITEETTAMIVVGRGTDGE